MGETIKAIVLFINVISIGVICASSKSPSTITNGKVTLEPFQSLKTSSARRSHSFWINEQLYLAVVNFDTQCDIYRFKDSKFVIAQQIKVNNANAAKFFKIADDYFLAIAKLSDAGSQYVTKSPVLKWSNATQQFENFQKFPSKGGFDWEHFTVTSSKNQNTHFLVLANSYDGVTYSVNSTIYVWDPSQKQFAHFQDIATKGAHHCAAFMWKNVTYLAIANYVSTSEVYMLNAKETAFVLHQTLPGTDYGSWAAVPVVFNNTLYLFDVIYEIDQVYQQKSPMFIWDKDSFKTSATIKTEGTTMMCPFSVEKQLYLALSNYFDGKSYNIESSVDFVEDSKSISHSFDVTTHGSYACHTFNMNGTVMVFFSNSYDDKTTELESVIYKVNTAT